MTTFQMRPVCAAALALLAQAAGAQTNDNQVATDASTPAAADAAAAAQTPVTPATPTQPAQVQQVTVKGLRSSIRSAEAIKGDSVQVVDSINAEDIGKFPDRAAGDALQRIAGVQVQRENG